MSTDITDNLVDTDDLDLPLLFSSRITFNPDEVNPRQVYNKGELEVINKFKDQYMAAPSPGQRKIIAQTQMFPMLFNYWKGKGIIYQNKDLRIKSNVCFH